MPKISMIVPIYKVEKYLARCIESILSQTFTDFELVLVDDGSPDNCGEICDEYAKKDRRITVIHKENGGLSDARNAGIDWAFKNSDSEWITFIDSDDWVNRRYLEVLFNAAIENQVDVSVCDFLRTSNFENTDIKDDFICQKWSVTDFFVEKNLNFVVAWGKLYKKSLFKKIRYPKGKVHEDEFTTHKLLFQCQKVVFVNSMLYFYFINKEGITAGKSEYYWNKDKIYFIQAMEEKISYFKKKHINEALALQRRQYFFSIYNYYNFVKQSSIIEHKKYSGYLKRKFRKAIRINKRNMQDYFRYRMDICEMAYPKLSCLYWHTIGKIKLKNKK